MSQTRITQPTNKALEYLTQLAAMEQSAEQYQTWLNSLTYGDKVNIRKESRDHICLIEAMVMINDKHEIIVEVDQEDMLPDGTRFHEGELIHVAKDAHSILRGVPRLTPIAPQYVWVHPLDASVMQGAAV